MCFDLTGKPTALQTPFAAILSAHALCLGLFLVQALAAIIITAGKLNVRYEPV